MKLPEISFRPPQWLEEFLEHSPDLFPGIEERMGFVIELARHNVRNRTGGPFAAAVFDRDGQLIAPGLNIVVTANCSIFHAEIMALALAQNILGRYDISDGGRLRYDLVASAEPCAMCFGAIPWSGVLRLVCGARDEDARQLGFDEGAKPVDWITPLNDRNIEVLRDVLRRDAVAVLKEYVADGGPIYNAGRPNGLDK